ncbi:MAG: hypothetical protein ABIJ18_01010 [archaeon]
MTKDIKEDIKIIVDKLTLETKSVFSEKVFNLAADLGIGELLVRESLHQLMEDNYIAEPMQGIIIRI